MLHLLLALIVSAESYVINVDSADCSVPSKPCYLIGDTNFRAATIIVVKHGFLVSAVDSLKALDTTNVSTIRKLNTKADLLNEKIVIKDSIITIKTEQITQAKWKFSAIGGAVGLLLGVVGTLVLMVAI